MTSRVLATLFTKVRKGKIAPDEAARRLREGTIEELSDIVLDHQRALRRGFPEVIFGAGKTDEQILAAVAGLVRRDSPALVTRITERTFRKICKEHPRAIWNDKAAMVAVLPARREKPRGYVGILAAGTSDSKVAEEAAFTAEVFGVGVERRYDVGVAGLHRLLRHRHVLLDADVLVVAAGMEGALPSVVAGLTAAPVVALPTSVGYGVGMKGLAALTTMLASCSPGVAVVNIDNGFGAGYLAASIAIRRHETSRLRSSRRRR